MKYAVSTVLVVIIGAHIGLANQLEDTLNQQYKDHVYTLRQPMTAPTQQYDSLGNSPTASALGPWTIYGRMQIRKIKLEPNRIVVEGRRIGMKFDDGARTLVPAKLDKKLKLEISLTQSVDSADQVRTAFTHVFAFTQEDFLAALPEFWRDYLVQHIESYADDGTRIVFKRPLSAKPHQQKPLSTTEPPSNGIYHVGKGVTAPKATFSPDPDYSDVARKENYQGTMIFNVVVDKTGAVSAIRIGRPLGMGLDERSVEKIKTWRFQPATKDGQPVAVEVSVEVSFNLY